MYQSSNLRSPLYFILLMKVIYPLHTNSDLRGRMIFWEDNRVSKNNLEFGHFKLWRRLNMVFDAYASPKKAEFEASLGYIVKAGREGGREGRKKRRSGKNKIREREPIFCSALIKGLFRLWYKGKGEHVPFENWFPMLITSKQLLHLEGRRKRKGKSWKGRSKRRERDGRIKAGRRW